MIYQIRVDVARNKSICLEDTDREYMKTVEEKIDWEEYRIIGTEVRRAGRGYGTPNFQPSFDFETRNAWAQIITEADTKIYELSCDLDIYRALQMSLEMVEHYR